MRRRAKCEMIAGEAIETDGREPASIKQAKSPSDPLSATR